jgi:hypothetical protein
MYSRRVMESLKTAWGLTKGLVIAADRRLPDFIIIGAQKGGTTSLYDYLTQHPDVEASVRKETHYFTFRYRYGARYFRAHFPRRRADGRATLTGEATPYYLFHPLAPARPSSARTRTTFTRDATAWSLGTWPPRWRRSRP